MNLSPSGLATALQKTDYSPTDIIKLKKGEQREERLIKEKREFDTLNKMYDTSMQVISNDYGVYQDEIVNDWTKASSQAASDIKQGKSAMDTVKYYDKFTSKVAKVNQLNQDEKKYAMFVDGNRLLSTEQKKKAIEDRMKSVMYDEDGTKRSLEDSSELSKTLTVDMAQYIDSESVYKDLLGSTQKTIRTDKVTGGTSSTQLYPWQKEDEKGKIVMDLIKDEDSPYYGLITEEAYQSFMSDSDRASKAEFEAKKRSKSSDEGDLELARREYATEVLAAHGDEGSQRIFQEARQYRTGTGKPPYLYTLEFNALNRIKVPTKDDAEKIPFSKGATGIDVTDEVRAIDKTVKKAYLDTNGTYYVARGVDAYGREAWIKSSDLPSVIRATDDPAVQSAWEKYSVPKAEKTEVPIEEKSQYTSVKDYVNTTTDQGNEITSIRVEGGLIYAIVDGESVVYKSMSEFEGAVGLPSVPKSKKAVAID